MTSSCHAPEDVCLAQHFSQGLVILLVLLLVFIKLWRIDPMLMLSVCVRAVLTAVIKMSRSRYDRIFNLMLLIDSCGEASSIHREVGGKGLEPQEV